MLKRLHFLEVFSAMGTRPTVRAPSRRLEPETVAALHISTDLTFLTNGPGKTLRERFEKLLATDTRFFDCLVGYFFVSGFYLLFPTFKGVEKIRILVGLKTNRTTHDLPQREGTRPASLRNFDVAAARSRFVR
jgi:hypothetical protein